MHLENKKVLFFIMSEIRLYLSPAEIKKNILITDKAYLHKIKNVLRLKKNQTIHLFDGKGKEWKYEITGISQKELSLFQLQKTQKSRRDSPQAAAGTLTLGFPLIQEKKIDFILQKATELGASRFIPFTSARTTGKKITKPKIERWEKIIIEACRQSERLWKPKIDFPVSLEKLISQKFNLKLLMLPKKDEAAITPAGPFLNLQPKSVLCLVGPEGGFSPGELKSCQKNNFKFFTLSLNLLRTETAAIFAAGLINYLFLNKK